MIALAKKKEFIDEELVTETEEIVEDIKEAVEDTAEKSAEVAEEVVETAAEAVEETAEKAEEIVAETDNDLEADEYGEDIDYEEVEDILAIDEAEKKRTLRRICAFVGAGLAAIGIIAAVYTFFFRKKD